MQFGFWNTPSVFQRFLNIILKDEIDTGWVKIYIDNILVHTMTRRENRKLVWRILKKLKENKLCLKLAKCKFEKVEVTFLGMRISHNKVMPDTKRLQASKEWPTPTRKKHVQRFLG
jgi:Reverse transcriptase (RNA-dependent DNA polymerase).